MPLDISKIRRLAAQSGALKEWNGITHQYTITESNLLAFAKAIEEEAKKEFWEEYGSNA